MNAPFAQRDIAAATRHAAALRVVPSEPRLLLHRGRAARRGDRALLLAAAATLRRRTAPSASKLTGYTLEEIAARDPAWIGARPRADRQRPHRTDRLRLRPDDRAAGAGAGDRRESAHRQRGLSARCWACRPRLALVNEQAYSARAGRALSRCRLSRDPDGLGQSRRRTIPNGRRRRAICRNARSAPTAAASRCSGPTPSRSRSCSVSRMAISRWTTICAMSRERAGANARALCLYASDAEIFDFRPGRLPHRRKTVAAQRMGADGRGLRRTGRRAPRLRARRAVADACCDAPMPTSRCGWKRAACPVPVKKQRKYNLARWAVTGRDDIAINAACERIYRGMAAAMRTTRTGKNFAICGPATSAPISPRSAGRRYCARLAAMPKQRWSSSSQSRHRLAATGGRLSTDALSSTSKRRAARARSTAAAALPSRRLHFAGMRSHASAACRTATSTTSRCRPTGTPATACSRRRASTRSPTWNGARRAVGTTATATSSLTARIETPKGPIEKTLRFCADEPRGRFRPRPSTGTTGARARCGWAISRCCPTRSTGPRFRLTTHNGGSIRKPFALARTDHRSRRAGVVPGLVARHGFGMTEGWAEIGDGKTGCASR